MFPCAVHLGFRIAYSRKRSKLAYLFSESDATAFQHVSCPAGVILFGIKLVPVLKVLQGVEPVLLHLENASCSLF